MAILIVWLNLFSFYVLKTLSHREQKQKNHPSKRRCLCQLWCKSAQGLNCIFIHDNSVDSYLRTDVATLEKNCDNLFIYKLFWIKKWFKSKETRFIGSISHHSFLPPRASPSLSKRENYSQVLNYRSSVLRWRPRLATSFVKLLFFVGLTSASVRQSFDDRLTLELLSRLKTV